VRRSGIASLVSRHPTGRGAALFRPLRQLGFSPLPKGPIATVTAMSQAPGTPPPRFVTIADAYLRQAALNRLRLPPPYGTGVIVRLTITKGGSGYANPLRQHIGSYWHRADVFASIDIDTGAIVDFTINNGGIGYTAPLSPSRMIPLFAEGPRSPYAAPGALATAVIGDDGIVGFTIVNEALATLPPLSPSRMLQAQARPPTRSSAETLDNPLTGGSASSSTACLAFLVQRLLVQTISGSTSRLLFPKSARLVVRQPTTTKLPWSSMRRRCIRTSPRPNCAVTCR